MSRIIRCSSSLTLGRDVNPKPRVVHRPLSIVHRPWSNAVLMLAAVGLVAACSFPGSHGETGAQPGDDFVSDIETLRPVDLGENDRLAAVATTSIVADVVSQVAGEAIDLVPLMPLGVDPHAFEPTPQDLRRVVESDVIFINGLGLESFIEKMLQNSGTQAAVISVSQGVQPLAFGQAEGEPGQGAVDPHTWLDPNNVVVWVNNIEAALSALDPARAAAYRERAAQYRSKLEALDGEIRELVAQIPEAERLLVTDHEELGYLAARYGFHIVGAIVPAYSTAAEPSAQEIAALESSVREWGARAVFVSAAVNPALSRRVAEDTGVRLIILYPHSLTASDGVAPDYLTLMRYNVRAIVQGLTP